MEQGFIDLRSDTITPPTPAMREAMANAAVGDDVYDEDPSINLLQEMSAKLLGKEAGLFIPSGTMGNLIAVLAHCDRGDEVIMGNLGHTFLFEGGGIAALGGVHPHTIPNQPDGTIKLDAIRDAIRSDNIHYPISRLIILENTHNRCGGVPLTVEYTQQTADLAHDADLKLHLDGARIFNAAAALQVEPVELTAPCDSITFCLSKGLCAPVGSVLCGTAAFIQKSLRLRKHLGGGMRQAGILAAAGIVALEKMSGRLAEDHQTSAKLSQGLAALPGLIQNPPSPATNMVFIDLGAEIMTDAEGLASRLADQNVKVGVVSQRRLRLVTHYWIQPQDIDQVVETFKQVLSAI
jgi:threonine aldolase